jgi:hypothetical protein
VWQKWVARKRKMRLIGEVWEASKVRNCASSIDDSLFVGLIGHCCMDKEGNHWAYIMMNELRQKAMTLLTRLTSNR